MAINCNNYIFLKKSIKRILIEFATYKLKTAVTDSLDKIRIGKFYMFLSFKNFLTFSISYLSSH